MPLVPASSVSNGGPQNEMQTRSVGATAATALTTGWITGIILFVGFGLVGLGILTCVYIRSQQHRGQAAQAQAQAHVEPKGGDHGAPRPTCEAPNTQIPPRELPDNQVVQQVDSNPRYELAG
ncbi:hypothetical protein GGS23DRAFT_564054 [Durotheca rogersii]|uniref:uncharacterized protein n=1 Tax=Durotheca rogersii TaxID=419775 RepID=UPI00221F7717|nr:uncharacterized protein GGS23DRAFT_564054 [Durotheca rogersii]KAI5864370.1 hypothetical protein GGS23DRAFT_564054 [Durotheca rogersii]